MKKILYWFGDEMKIDKYEVKDKRVYVYPDVAKGQSIAYEVIDDNTITVMGLGKLTRVK